MMHEMDRALRKAAFNDKGEQFLRPYGVSVPGNRGLGMTADHGDEGLPPLYPRPSQWQYVDSLREQVLAILNITPKRVKALERWLKKCSTFLLNREIWTRKGWIGIEYGAVFAVSKMCLLCVCAAQSFARDRASGQVGANTSRNVPC